MFIGSVSGIGGAATGPAAAYPATGAASGSFSFALERAEQSGTSPPQGDYLANTLKPLAQALEGVNGEAKQMGSIADAMQSAGADLSPGSAVMLSMQCSEFMFHCELTATAANQGADGLQELFKEQG